MREQIPQLPSGSDAEAVFVQNLHARAYGRGHQFRNSSTVKFSRTSQGIFAKVRIPKAASGSPITPYTYVGPDSNGDYIICRPIGGPSDGSADVKVLKPYLLRFSIAQRVVSGVIIQYTNYNSGAQSRTATNSGGAITQTITPRYLFGDELQIAARSDGKKIDLNVDGRVFSGPSV